MVNSSSDYKRAVVLKRTVLGYELDTNQNIWTNFLLPSILGCLLYILQIAADVGVVYGHFRGGNPVWASLTLFFMYCPAIGCFVWVTSAWELWAEAEGCGVNNVKWIFLKILEHLLFPVWSIWRYAERIFWCIDALISSNEEDRESALENVNVPRTVEFYYFLQAFLHSLPQILLQVHILMRFTSDMELQTMQAQIMSIILNLIKLSIVTTLYQRFKTLKIGGKDYPWYKAYKYEDNTIDTVDSAVTMRRAVIPQRTRKRTGIIYATRETVDRLKKEYEVPNSMDFTPDSAMDGYTFQRRTSSDLYLLPSGIVGEDEIDEKDATLMKKGTSVVDGPPRIILHGTGIDETDSPRRLRDVKGLPEDDIVGKLVACLWWFCFLIARILAISSFAYFYPRDVLWLIAVHFIICEAFLIYDVQTYVVRRTKALFYIFIGIIYIFCIIEFMKKFKKAKFIYYGFFVLVFAENFITSMIWWFSNLETDEIQNDWWFKFIFYAILGCTLLSLSSMFFYLCINKPEKVVVDQEEVEGNTI